MEDKVAKEGLLLTNSQVTALEPKKIDDEASGEIETHHPGYVGSQDTFYVRNLKGVGRIYQQTFVNTYAKWHLPTNGICERFHKTILQEFYQVTFCKKTFRKARRVAKGSGRMDEVLHQ